MLNNPEKKLPTDEQVAILDAVRKRESNLLVNALAGTGKTTTIEFMIEEFPRNTWLYLAFNTSIVKEAREKLPPDGEISTLNSLGHRAWGAATGKRLYITGGRPKAGEPERKPKMVELVGAIAKDTRGKEDRDEIWENAADIYQACAMAKHLGYIPEGAFTHIKPLATRGDLQGRLETEFTPWIWEVIDTALVNSIRAAYEGWIDFDDQIYMSALFGGTFQGYTNVLVDEVQDLSPTNFEMLRRLGADWVAGVGDRWQSIYAFRGATTNGVDRMKQMFNMAEMPLSVSFRCPSEVVKAVHWHVPHMKWSKTGGEFRALQTLDHSQIRDGSTIICRNNAPLFSAAFALLSHKRSVSVAGSDIGPKIIKLLQKIGRDGDSSEVLIDKIEAWRNEKLAHATASSTVEDTAACLKIFATWGKDLYQAVQYCNHILKQQGSILLTTGHKAKGREWENVFHLNPSLIRDEDQDRNLHYVITTRAKQTIHEIESENIQWL